MACSTLRCFATCVGILASAGTALAQPGWVLSHQKVSDTQGGFTGTLDNEDRFGFSVASLGDLDGDGVGDIVVGAPWDDDGGTDRGAVWVLFLNPDGTVNSHQKISDTEGAFTGMLDNSDRFGWSVSSLGDLDGDGVTDLAVCAVGDDDGGIGHGAVWVLFLNASGTVNSHQKISDTAGNFTGTLSDNNMLGGAATSLGDLDGAGPSVIALAVSAWADDDGGTNRGAVWVLFLNADGTVNSHQKISGTAGGFTGILDDYDQFGTGLASMGDLDGDGVADLAVGANQDDDGGAGDNDRGAVWVLFLNSSGTVNSHQKISDTTGGFTGELDDGDELGGSVASPGDFNGDGVGDLAVGAGRDDDGGTDRGAVWMLFLNSDGTVKAHQKISDTQGGFNGTLDSEDIFGGVAALGDHDGDGVADLAVGAGGDDDGGTEHGAVWVLFLADCCPCSQRGDMNGDGLVNGDDIALFVQKLLNP